MLASIVLWAVCLPPAWAAVNIAHATLTDAAGFPTELGGTVFSYVYGGVVPLGFGLPALFHLGRVRPETFRLGAVAVSLLLGSWLGFYFVRLDDPVIQSVVLAWIVFGALLPRPPGRAGGPGTGPEPR